MLARYPGDCPEYQHYLLPLLDNGCTHAGWTGRPVSVGAAAYGIFADAKAGWQQVIRMVAIMSYYFALFVMMVDHTAFEENCIHKDRLGYGVFWCCYQE